MALPYDAERVMQLRSMLREARKQKLSAGLRARRKKNAMTTLTMRYIKGHFVVIGPDVPPMKFKFASPKPGTGARRIIPARPSQRSVGMCPAGLRRKAKGRPKEPKGSTGVAGAAASRCLVIGT